MKNRSQAGSKDLSRRLALYGLMIALAFVFSYIEVLIPFNLGIPGVKLGLSNLVVIVSMVLLSRRDALVIAVVRIVLVGFTFGSPYSMLYSLCGGLLSFAVMALLLPSRHLSLIGVSMAGGITHNIGQLLFSMVVTQTVRIAYYVPVLLVSGVLTGALIGVAATLILRRLRRVRLRT